MAENEFKKLGREDKLPAEHRQEVLNSIDSLKLIANMLDMFSIKQAKTDLSLLDSMSKSISKRPDNPPKQS